MDPPQIKKKFQSPCSFLIFIFLAPFLFFPHSPHTLITPWGGAIIYVAEIIHFTLTNVAYQGSQTQDLYTRQDEFDKVILITPDGSPEGIKDKGSSIFLDGFSTHCNPNERVCLTHPPSEILTVLGF